MMEKKKSLTGRLLFFIIWPFGAFIHSLTTPQSHGSRLIFYLWFVLFGLCFLPVNEEADSYEYAQRFYNSKNMSEYTYQRDVEEFFTNSFNSDTKDIYVLTAFYIVSRVTDNVHVLFMLFAMVFGFFYVKSMKYALYSEGNARSDLIFYILFGWFCISNPIFNINGVRFWTAAWIGVYIMFRYLVKEDWKVLLLLPIVYLVHASFVFYIAVFLIYILFRKFHKAWNIVFMISLFFSGLSFLPMISEYIMDYLPLNLQMMLQYYSSDEYVAYRTERLETLSIYARFFMDLPKIAINLIAVLCLLNRKKLEKNEIVSKILEFVVILLSLSNILSTIPSGGRFLNMVIPFFVYLLVTNIQFAKQYKWVVYLIPVMYIYPVYLWLLNVHAVTSLSIYFTPLPFHFIKFLFA